MIIVLPTPHRPSSVSDGFDHEGSWNQSGPWIPRWPRIVFTGPVAGLRMNTNPSVAATGGARAEGAEYRVHGAAPGMGDNEDPPLPGLRPREGREVEDRPQDADAALRTREQ